MGRKHAGVREIHEVCFRVVPSVDLGRGSATFRLSGSCQADSTTVDAQLRSTSGLFEY